MNFVQVTQALILGLTQGLSEFIPVSSSGHLIIVGHLIGFRGSSLGFDTALDLGTLAALVAFFWRDIWELAVASVKGGPKTRLAWTLILATIPAVVVGFWLQSRVETVFRSSQVVAVNLIVVAVVMLAADRWGRRRYGLDQVTPARGLVIGLAQAIAVIPGVSRSGITISAGLFEGLDRVSATRFSFLLSAPIIAGATAKVMLKGSNLHQLAAEPLLYAVGIAAAGVSGYVAIKFMLKYLSRHGLAAFAYYRIAAGLLILVLGLK